MLGILKAVNVFFGVRVPNIAGIFHDMSDECGVALGPSVSWDPRTFVSSAYYVAPHQGIWGVLYVTVKH